MKSTLIILLLVAFFSCKTTHTEFSKRQIINLDASINPLNIHDILTDDGYNKSFVVIFENKQYPIKKLDSILKNSNAELTANIQKDSVSGKNYILISRKN